MVYKYLNKINTLKGKFRIDNGLELAMVKSLSAGYRLRNLREKGYYFRSSLEKGCRPRNLLGRSNSVSLIFSINSLYNSIIAYNIPGLRDPIRFKIGSETSGVNTEYIIIIIIINRGFIKALGF